MRVLVYKLLTQAIIILGHLRKRLIAREWQERPAGRVFDVFHLDAMECCDCGLVHEAEYFEERDSCNHQPLYEGLQIVGHMWPRRPKGYDYSWRKGAAKSDLALPEEPE